MINLKEYISESILDVDDNIDNVDKNIKDQIKQFLNDNFDKAFLYKISDKPNADGKYEVSSSNNITVENKKITSLTNKSFIWTTVDGDFDCSDCKSLKSLEGAPKEVENFSCTNCTSLKSLEGASKEVYGDFLCSYCGIKFTTDDVKKVSNVKGNIIV